MGVRVPEDLSVIGFDDIESARYAGLTTVRQPLFESGRLGASMLLDGLNGLRAEPAPHVELPLEIVVRRDDGRRPAAPSASNKASSSRHPQLNRPPGRPVGLPTKGVHPLMTRTISLRRGLFAGAATLAAGARRLRQRQQRSSSSATTAAGGAATTAGRRRRHDDAGGAATTAARGAATTRGGGSRGADIKGKTVKMLGTEVAGEADGVTGAFKPWEQQTGAKLSVHGHPRRARRRSARRPRPAGAPCPTSSSPRSRASSRTSPRASRRCPPDLVDEDEDRLDPFLVTLGTVNGQVLGVPVKADLKSLVWYSPKVFQQHNYQIPQTWDEMTDAAATR